MSSVKRLAAFLKEFLKGMATPPVFGLPEWMSPVEEGR